MKIKLLSAVFAAAMLLTSVSYASDTVKITLNNNTSISYKAYPSFYSSWQVVIPDPVSANQTYTLSITGAPSAANAGGGVSYLEVNNGVVNSSVQFSISLTFTKDGTLYAPPTCHPSITSNLTCVVSGSGLNYTMDVKSL